jgi:hypothetical protein
MKIYTKGEKHMGPKYSKGNKVRIKSQNILGRGSDSSLKSYENMVGEILDETNIVAFLTSPWTNIAVRGEQITIYHYTVRINDQVTLFDVTEDYLEIIQ